MKNAIFTLLTIISISQFSIAQSNTDFVNLDNQWNVVTSFGGGLGSTTKYRFDTDSIVVDNVSYFTMEYSTEEMGNDWIQYNLTAYRQEENRVYQLNLNDSTEFLLYDFGLSIGDVLLGSDYVGEPDLTVVAIDSIELEDGSYRKQLQMSSGNSCTIPWVEGFGSIYYSFNSAMYTCFADIGDNLICFSQNGITLFYENEEFFGCWWENEPQEPYLIDFRSQWNVLYSSQFNGSKTTSKFRFNPNPIYDIHNYFHLERSNEEDGDDWTLIGTQAYRETFGSVYLYNVLDSTEVLIHDFKLELGDIFTSKMSINDPGIELTVIAVDSLQLLDGTMKKRLTLSCPFGSPIEWVEGIGNMNYPLSGTVFACFLDVPGNLLCYSEDEETLYDSGSETNGCWFDYESQANNLINNTSKWNILTSSQFNSDVVTTIHNFDALPRIYNGKEYYQMEYLDDPASVNWVLDETHAFREEGDEVYLYNIQDDFEVLIHDFGLSVGETFLSKQSMDDPGTLLTVIEVDSLELINGTLRKRITLSCELNNTISWVKGIGNIDYPLTGTISSCLFDLNTQILCYSEFGQTEYEGVDNIEGCFVTDVNEIPESEITIYPNPVNDYLYIDAENPISIAKIYNLQGQLLLKKNNVTDIQLSTLNTGMYFLHLVNSKGQALSKKIFVE